MIFVTQDAQDRRLDDFSRNWFESQPGNIPIRVTCAKSRSKVTLKCVNPKDFRRHHKIIYKTFVEGTTMFYGMFYQSSIMFQTQMRCVCIRLWFSEIK